MNIAQQTLYYQGPNHSSVEKDYVLSDEAGLFICFDTAQQADDWIRIYTPGVVTHYQINKRSNTLTEGKSMETGEMLEYYGKMHGMF